MQGCDGWSVSLSPGDHSDDCGEYDRGSRWPARVIATSVHRTVLAMSACRSSLSGQSQAQTRTVFITYDHRWTRSPASNGVVSGGKGTAGESPDRA